VLGFPLRRKLQQKMELGRKTPSQGGGKYHLRSRRTPACKVTSSSESAERNSKRGRNSKGRDVEEKFKDRHYKATRALPRLAPPTDHPGALKNAGGGEVK